MHPFSAYYFSAEVAKSVDAVDSKSTVEIRAGSSPAFGTIKYCANKKPPKGGFVLESACRNYLPTLLCIDVFPISVKTGSSGCFPKTYLIDLKS